MKIKKFVALGATLMLAGCVTGGERVAFHATGPNQQSMVRDGRPALVSRQKNSIVLVGPAGRELQAGGRPVFVVGINNIGKTPIDFRMDQIQVSQLVGGQEYPMRVVTYEMLAQEERTGRSPSQSSQASQPAPTLTARRAQGMAPTRPRAAELAPSTARQPRSSPRTTRLLRMRR